MTAIDTKLAHRLSRVGMRRVVRELLTRHRGDHPDRSEHLDEARMIAPNAFPLVLSGQGEYRKCRYPKREPAQ